MKPSERIKELLKTELRLAGTTIWDCQIAAIIQYLDEQFSKELNSGI